jgi:hypothetical protein
MSDLNTRIARWRIGLEAGDALTEEALDELESHLRDEHEQLVGAGLADDEAFLIAARRLGRSETLDAEFAKVAPSGGWGRRAHFMVLGAGFGLLGIQLAKILGHVGQSLASEQRNYWGQTGFAWAGALFTLLAIPFAARFVLNRSGPLASGLARWLSSTRRKRYGTLRIAGVVLFVTVLVQGATLVTELWAIAGVTSTMTAVDFGQLTHVQLMSDMLLAALAPMLLVLAALRHEQKAQHA